MRLIPVIVGPTASGKSELGIRLALALDGEIINLDSVQVYRRIQIATAKVPLAQRRGVPHHLIDIVEPTENFTAGEYARVADQTIRSWRFNKHIGVSRLSCTNAERALSKFSRRQCGDKCECGLARRAPDGWRRRHRNTELWRTAVCPH